MIYDELKHFLYFFTITEKNSNLGLRQCVNKFSKKLKFNTISVLRYKHLLEIDIKYKIFTDKFNHLENISLNLLSSQTFLD